MSSGCSAADTRWRIGAITCATFGSSRVDGILVLFDCRSQARVEESTSGGIRLCGEDVEADSGVLRREHPENQRPKGLEVDGVVDTVPGERLLHLQRLGEPSREVDARDLLTI